jgi:hypothetical protein
MLCGTYLRDERKGQGEDERQTKGGEERIADYRAGRAEAIARNVALSG